MSETTAVTPNHQALDNVEPDAVPLLVKVITYKDLLDEEQRLTLELKRNKARVMEDIDLIKDKLQPAGQALNFMNKLSGGTGKPGILSTGVDITLDLLSKKYFFRRSGWLVTLAGSYLLRGVTQLLLQRTRLKQHTSVKVKSNGQDHTLAGGITK